MKTLPIPTNSQTCKIAIGGHYYSLKLFTEDDMAKQAEETRDLEL